MFFKYSTNVGGIKSLLVAKALLCRFETHLYSYLLILLAFLLIE